MSNVTYYVAMGFQRDETGELVAMDPVEVQSSTQAISRARSLAATKAGAVAFSRTGDPENGGATIESLQRAAKIVGWELRLAPV
jgi:hypothetical protein